jgi:dihydropteroate synthase
MGILNVTPDSFSDGGHFFSTESASDQAEKMILDGADIIDIGGESSRPGSSPVSPAQQCERVLPVIQAIHDSHPDTPISIDTTSSEVARNALDCGACIINDISGLTYDNSMSSLAGKTQAGIVIMHMQGTPQNIQNKPQYQNCVTDIASWLHQRIVALTDHGIAKTCMVIDPGIGFGKKCVHNLEILNQLAHFTSLGQPILIGASRKRFIGETGKTENPSDRLPGSLAALTCAVLQGANVLRVHDVKESIQATRVATAIRSPEGWRNEQKEK